MVFQAGKFAQVLLVEDDEALGSGLKLGLEQSQFHVSWAASLEAARQAKDEADYSIILLDLGMPDGTGLVFLQELRRQGDTTPVMIVTATGQREMRIGGLNAGADDYITKPYDLDEVIARTRALLRRSEGRGGDLVHFDRYLLDIKGQIVRDEDQTIKLTLREFRVLALLTARAGRWVSKRDIELSIYDESTDIESNTVEAAIYGLRKKLGGQTILTARGLGYMVGR